MKVAEGLLTGYFLANYSKNKMGWAFRRDTSGRLVPGRIKTISKRVEDGGWSNKIRNTRKKRSSKIRGGSTGVWALCNSHPGNGG